MAHTTICANYMPPMDTILHMKRISHVVNMRGAEEYVQEALDRFENLFDKPDEFIVTYSAYSPEDALQGMESFV